MHTSFRSSPDFKRRLWTPTPTPHSSRACHTKTSPLSLTPSPRLPALALRSSLVATVAQRDGDCEHYRTHHDQRQDHTADDGHQQPGRDLGAHGWKSIGSWIAVTIQSKL